MVIRVFYGEEFKNEHEMQQFREIYDLVKAKYDQKNEVIFILFNFCASDAQIDVTLITKTGPAIIELKNYEGVVWGNENGPWTVKASKGDQQLDNVFAQLKKQKFALLGKLNAVREHTNTQNMAQIDERKFANIKCWVYFKKGSINKTQIDPKNLIWFDVITGEKLLEKIQYVNAGYLLTSEDMDNIVKELHLQEYYFATRKAEATITNEKEEFAGPHLKQFRDCLSQYGLEQKEDTLIDAIRSSYLSAGKHPVELAEKEAGVLRQIGIGWSGLTQAGKALGQELIDSSIKTETSILTKIIERYPPRVIKLFLSAAQKSDETLCLRIPVKEEESDEFSSLVSISALPKHRKIQYLIVDLGHDLQRAGLGIMYNAPAYSKATWDAHFIYLPTIVAEKMLEKQKNSVASLDKVEEVMSKLNLLKRLPVPSLKEFNTAGLSKEMLLLYLGSACESGAISKLSEKGPAFLIFDEQLYRNLVLIPLFNNIIDIILEEPEEKRL